MFLHDIQPGIIYRVVEPALKTTIWRTGALIKRSSTNFDPYSDIEFVDGFSRFLCDEENKKLTNPLFGNYLGSNKSNTIVEPASKLLILFYV